MSRELSCREVCYHLQVVIDVLNLEVGEALHSHTGNGVQVLFQGLILVLICREQSNLGVVGGIALHQLGSTATIVSVKHTVEVGQSLQFGDASVRQQVRRSQQMLICFATLDHLGHSLLIGKRCTGKNAVFQEELHICHVPSRHIAVEVLVFQLIADGVRLNQSVPSCLGEGCNQGLTSICLCLVFLQGIGKSLGLGSGDVLVGSILNLNSLLQGKGVLVEGGIAIAKVGGIGVHLLNGSIPLVTELLCPLQRVVSLGLNEATKASGFVACILQRGVNLEDVVRSQLDGAVVERATLSKDIHKLGHCLSLLTDGGQVEVHRVIAVLHHGRQHNRLDAAIGIVGVVELGILHILQADELIGHTSLFHEISHGIHELVYLVDLCLGKTADAHSIASDISAGIAIDGLTGEAPDLGCNQALDAVQKCTGTGGQAHHLLRQRLELGSVTVHDILGLSKGRSNLALSHSAVCSATNAVGRELLLCRSEVVTGIYQRFSKELLELLNGVGHLKDSLAFSGIRSQSLIRIADLRQKVIKELLHLHDDVVVSRLQLDQLLQDIAVCQHSLHGVCDDLRVCLLVRNRLATLTG